MRNEHDIHVHCEALASLTPSVAHSVLCHYLRMIAADRRVDAPVALALLLRKVSLPLPVDTCRALADYLDPKEKAGRGRKPDDHVVTIEKRWHSAVTLGTVQAALKKTEPTQSPADVKRFDAKVWKVAAELVGFTVAQLKNHVAGPFEEVVRASRTGEKLSEIQYILIKREYREGRKLTDAEVSAITDHHNSKVYVSLND